jgi:ankyrin repeat protein
MMSVELEAVAGLSATPAPCCHSTTRGAQGALAIVGHPATLLAAIKLPGRSSALHDAGMAGQVSSINVLVAAGGDVDAKDEYEATPLHLALRYGMDEAAVALSY